MSDMGLKFRRRVNEVRERGAFEQDQRNASDSESCQQTIDATFACDR